MEENIYQSKSLNLLSVSSSKQTTVRFIVAGKFETPANNTRRWQIMVARMNGFPKLMVW